jgi:hypothetical protein
MAGLVALALAITAATAGLGFVWCAPMQSARLSCCCPHDAALDLRIGRDCCEERTLEGLDVVERPERAPQVIASPRVALLPLSSRIAPLEIDARAGEPERRSARAGPSARLHANVSVFLI